jgi:hypothetical protein
MTIPHKPSKTRPEQKFIIHTPEGNFELWAGSFHEAQEIAHSAIQPQSGWIKEDIRIEATTEVSFPKGMLGLPTRTITKDAKK